MNLETLRADCARLRRDSALRQREIAAQLGLSEAELLAAHVGVQTLRLNPDWPGLLSAIASLGEVMALTRNHACVHEKIGVYHPVRFEGQVGLVLGPDIDLRAFLARWAYGYAVEEPSSRGVARSLQFFDAHGVAIHKIHLRAQSHHAAWSGLLARFGASDQQPGLSLAAPKPTPAARADHEIDVAGLRAAWAALADTHDFAAMLACYDVSREQALRLAGTTFARHMECDVLDVLLQAASDCQLPLMVFVGNSGMLQIHCGPIRKFHSEGPWLNIMDPGFNLHLRRDLIASAWAVSKPTADGPVSSLELYDAQGESVALLFGARKPGKPELGAWRALLDSLSQEGAPCAS